MSHPQVATPVAPHDDDDIYSDNPETFHALGPIGRAASILLGASVFTHLLSTISDWHTYNVVRDYLGGKPDVEDAALNSADTFARLTSIPNVAISVAAAVVFVLWLWRARLNSEVFCRADHRYGHAWVLGSWICPGPNLVYPKAIVDDVLVTSDRATPAWTDELTKYRRLTITTPWWLCWVGAMLLDIVLRRVLMWLEPSIGTLRLTAYSSTVSLVLSAVSAAFAVLIIRRITAMQTGRPWIAWWDIDDEAVSGSPFPEYSEDDEPSWAQEPAYAGSRQQRSEPMGQPLYVDAPQPAFAGTSPLTLVPDLPVQQPAWNQPAAAALDEPARRNLRSLPSLPEFPTQTTTNLGDFREFDSGAVPEPPAPAATTGDGGSDGEPSAWSPFASMVEQWREEIEGPEDAEETYAAQYEEPVFAREVPDHESGTGYANRYSSYDEDDYDTGSSYYADDYTEGGRAQGYSEDYSDDGGQDTQYFQPDFDSEPSYRGYGDNEYGSDNGYQPQREYAAETEYGSTYSSEPSYEPSYEAGPQYTEPQYTEPQYTEPQYTEPQHTERPYAPEPQYSPEPQYAPEPEYTRQPVFPQESPLAPAARLSPEPDLPQAPSLPQAPVLPQAPSLSPSQPIWPSSAGDQPAWVAEYQARRQPRGFSEEPPRPIPSPPTPPLTLVPAPNPQPEPVRQQPVQHEPVQRDDSPFTEASRHFDPAQYSEPARYSEPPRPEPAPYAAPQRQPQPEPEPAPRPVGRRARRMPADYVEQPPDSETPAYTSHAGHRSEPPRYADADQYRAPAQDQYRAPVQPDPASSLPPAPLEPRNTFVDVEQDAQHDTGSQPTAPRAHPRGRRWSV